MTSPRRVPLVLPELGLGAWPVTVGQWLVRPGATVLAGDRVLEALSDGVAIDVSAPVGGRIVEQSVGPDEAVVVGQMLGVIEQDE